VAVVINNKGAWYRGRNGHSHDVEIGS